MCIGVSIFFCVPLVLLISEILLLETTVEFVSKLLYVLYLLWHHRLIYYILYIIYCIYINKYIYVIFNSL